jgi:broad specificity phosphatase PhoE
VTVHLVRHGKAGSRETWEQPDDLRPLSARGRSQAEALVRFLAGQPIDRILSSRFVRGVQSVQPLADERGLTVEWAEGLAEEARDDEVIALLKEVSKSEVVLSTHGNIIPVILDHVAGQGVEFRDAPHVWQKGSVWVLDTDHEGTFTTARYVPPTD